MGLEHVSWSVTGDFGAGLSRMVSLTCLGVGWLSGGSCDYQYLAG